MKSKTEGIANRPVKLRATQPRLPHEHDESSDSQGVQTEGVRKIIKHAHDDIVSGKQDTDLHGTPGLDKPTK